MKKLSTIILTICLVSMVFTTALVPQPAQAGGFAAAAAVVVQTVWQKLVSTVTDFIQFTVKQLAIESIDMFAQKLAYETATSLATGGKGQQTLFEGKVFQDILKDAAGAAAGDFIGGLSDEWSDLGIDLCNPDLEIKATITMSLLKFTTPQFREPRCDLADVVRNWEGFIAETSCVLGYRPVKTGTGTIGNDGTVVQGHYSEHDVEKCTEADIAKAQAELLQGLQVQFRPGKSDFSAQLALNDGIAAKIDEEKIIAQLERLKSAFKPKTNVTGTQVQTTEEQVEQASEIPLASSLQSQALKAQAALDSKFPILARSLSTFGNTLLAKLLERYTKEGLYKLSDAKNFSYDDYDEYGNRIDTSGPGGTDPGGTTGGNPFDNPISTSAIEQYYSEAFVTSIGSLEQYNPADEFIVCPGEGARTLNNCVMDPKFYSAFSKNEPITVSEAIDLRLLDANTPLISDESYLHSDLQYCHKDALCFSNLQKMRLARFIPLGWEIAARESEIENPATLGEAMADFDTVGSKFYKLIDPDWILVAPSAQCRAKGFGPILETPSSTNRSEVCVDTQTCLKTDSNGECLPGAWGYCTREKNIWQFGGEQCSSAFASCRSYEANNKTNYYIKDTLDFCTAEEVGCKLYSTIISSYDDNGVAIWSEDTADKIMLNGQANSCEGQNIGCTELIKVEPGVNLIHNGSFELDENNDGEPDGWNYSNENWYLNDNKKHSGTYSVGTNNGGGGSNIEIDFDNLIIGRDYTLSAYVYAMSSPDNIEFDLIDYESLSPTNLNRWEKYEISFNANSDTARLRFYVHVGEAYLDDVQLEIGSQASQYTDYGTRNLSYIKKAPDYLDCDNDWVPACDNYAPSCDENELGCNLYIPTNGDPAIPGIVSSGDYCSADCSGYEQYLQENTELDTWFESEDILTYHSFIADTAQSCNLADVGCEAFTNVTEGENIEYYKSLRMCVLEDNPDATTYYTWEGSETSGYELRVWNLLKSDVDEGPCTNVKYNGTNNFCNDTVNGIDTCENEDDPECRIYIDEDNEEYLRKESKVVKASSECSLVRRAVSSADMAMILSSESGSCSEAAVGCKVYRGNDGSNTRRVFVDDFETGTGGWTNGGLVSEAIVIGGHSYKVYSGDTDHSKITSRNINIQSGKTYTLSFWMKTDDNKREDIEITFNGNSNYRFNTSGTLDTSTEWKQYHLGPVYFDGDAQGATLELWSELTKISLYYIDNIILKEINSDLYLIRDSWQTPSQCTVADLGCDEYEDKLGNIHYLSSFDSLCSESVVGCSMFIDTKNTRTISEKTWDPNGQSIETDADELIYLVDDNQYYCSSRDKGCSELGVPQISFDENGDSQIDSWESTYLINDPEQYELTLCSEEALNCEAYKSEGQTIYMQDPGGRTCTFLDSYEFNGELLNGWYLTSSVEDINAQEKVPCNGDGQLYKRRDTGPDNFAGECAPTASGCTEFIDPQGTQGDNLLFNSEFEIKTTDTDEAPDFWCQSNKDCEGFVSVAEGYGRDGTDGIEANYLSPEDNEAFSQKFSIDPNENYTVNFDLKFIGANGSFFDYEADDNEGGNNQNNAGIIYKNLSLVKAAHAAQVAIIGKYYAGLRCTAGNGSYVDIDSYDESFEDMGNGVYRMTVEDSQSSLQDYYSYSGKFRVNSTESEINCTVSFGSEENSTFFLDNTAVRKSQSYFYINSSDINGADCNGQVSWEKGCVLTLDTSNIDTDGEVIRQYDSSASYNQSVSNGGSLTVVSGCEPGNSNCYSDSNRIIKVVKNRECSEWLACRSSSYSTEVDGSVKEYCYDLGRCTELSPSGNNCIQWREMDDEILTEDVYTSRETGWSGQEYSGYSLLNKYNLESLLARTKLDNSGSALELSYEGNESDGIGDGPDGGIVSPTCRLFPSEDAPFSTVGLNGIAFDDLGNIITKPLQMPQANFCSQRGDCECNYQKVTYSQGEERYYRSGYGGFDTIDYGDGVKSTVKSVNDYRGFWGFCLERDYSRTILGYGGGENPCLTWMPLDILSGEYNSEGVNIADDLNLNFSSMYYCAQSEGNYPYTDIQTVTDSIVFGANAVEDPGSQGAGSSWEPYTCGALSISQTFDGNNEVNNLFPRWDAASSPYPFDSTLALCLVNKEDTLEYYNHDQGDVVSIGLNLSSVDNDENLLWNSSYEYGMDYISSIEFENIVSGSVYEPRILDDGVMSFIDGSTNEEKYYDCNSGTCELAIDEGQGLLRLPSNGGSRVVSLDENNQIDCNSYDPDSYLDFGDTIRTVHDDFCADYEKIWVRVFVSEDVYGDGGGNFNPGTSVNEDPDSAQVWTEVEGDYSGFLNIDHCLAYGIDTCRGDLPVGNNHEYGLLLAFLVGFDANDNVVEYKLIAGQNHRDNCSSECGPQGGTNPPPNAISNDHAFIYKLNVLRNTENALATEICTEVVRVEAPKFNEFFYGTSIDGSYQLSDRSAGVGNWYGLIGLPEDFTGWTSLYNKPVYVESSFGHDDTLPFIDVSQSIARENSIIRGSDNLDSPIGNHYFGVDPNVGDGFLSINNINSRKGSTGFAVVIDALTDLFAKIVGRYTWSNVNNNYGNVGYNYSDTYASGESVNILQVDNTSGFAKEGNPGITINDRNSGPIEHEGIIYNATLKFYAYNKTGNQIPISKLQIDWDDGSKIFGKDDLVSLKNHKNICVNSCSTSYLGFDTFNDTYFDLVNLGSVNPNSWSVDGKEATLIQEPGWNGVVGDPTRNYSGIYLRSGVLLQKPKFRAGDILTLEYDYKIEGIINSPVQNYWCYGVGNCSQIAPDGSPKLEGQTELYSGDKMLYFDRLDRALTNGESCPDGSNPRDNWCTYSSTVIVTSETVNGCVNDDNQSGYCLREMGIALRSDREDTNNETIEIRNVRLRTSCRSNSECPGSNNICEPENIGNDLRYCVDDYDNGIGYFSFNHTYICSDTSDNARDSDNSDTSCIYKPRVYVEDNWGWCSAGYGSLAESPYNQGDCLDIENKPLDSAWMTYADYIEITP